MDHTFSADLCQGVTRKSETNSKPEFPNVQNNVVLCGILFFMFLSFEP
jgi:hypothetical protein